MSEPTQSQRPNILFLYPDQHRHDWVGANAQVPVRTPHLDTLGERGVRFTHAVTPSPLCAPARACLAAGKEYDRCRVASNQVDYPLDQPTFYAILRDAGYHMLGCGKFDLDKASEGWGVDGKRMIRRWGFTDGIDNEGKWDAIRSGAVNPKGPYMAYLQRAGLLADHVADFERRRGKKDATFPTTLPDEAYCDNWMAENGLALLRQVPVGEPWCLQVNYTGPHEPWDITVSMEASVRGLTGLPPVNDSDEFDPETHTLIRQNYTAMVENIDRWTGLYLDELARRGELANTLVIYASDHGEMLGDHKQWGKSTPCQPAVGVPLVIAGPGVEAGRVIDAPATTLDVTSTILECAGLPTPEEMDSRSLWPILDGGASATREHVLSGLADWRVVFDGRNKLVQRFGQAPSLYDLDEDPGENVDIASRRPDLVKRLASHLT